MITAADIALTIIQAGAMISILAFMFSRGLRTRTGDLKYIGSRQWLLLGSLISVDVLVPLIALTVVMIVMPAKATAVGLMLLAASPAAPMVFRKISKAGGNQEYAVSLHLVLAALAIVTTPLTLSFLSGVTGLQLEISSAAVAERIGISILLPIVAGITMRWLFPALAEKITGPLEGLANIVLILVIVVVLSFTYQLILSLDIRSYIAMALMIAGALVAGHLMAAGQREEQPTLALESATRNVGLSLLIASAYAPLEKALPILVPYLLTAMILSTFYTMYVKKILHAKYRDSAD